MQWISGNRGPGQSVFGAMLLGVSGLGLLSGGAIAADDFVPGDKIFSGDAELGGTLTTGNSKSASIKGRLDMKHELGQWENKYLLEALYSENDDGDSEDSTVTQTYQAGIQGNYRFDPRRYLFANGNYFRDPSTGYNYTVTTALGYGHRLHHSDNAFIDVEIGPGYQYQRLIGAEAATSGVNSEDSLVLHSVLAMEYQIAEGSVLKQKFTADYGDKILARSESAITARIIGALRMKFAVTVRYDDQPLAGKKSTDTETTMTLLYGF
ncbi:hypothetical protein NFHSH190041_09650 [Shewanella sp. NFH-SH190041]|nr:DUF481 domain-containing protein [Shewanella sp. NFH-SH190041]BDM63513.1 hypothetical protein NFHSH190041_09650 [Shewanella sp. NFH-SH190041]